METQQIVGVAMVIIGFVDAMASRFILAPKLKDSPQKKIILGVVLSGALVFFAAGAALLNRWIRLPL